MRIKFKARNGEFVEAPAEEWIAAIMVSLPPEIQQRIFERVAKKMVAYMTPGSYVLHAEGLSLSELVK